MIDIEYVHALEEVAKELAELVKKGIFERRYYEEGDWRHDKFPDGYFECLWCGDYANGDPAYGLTEPECYQGCIGRKVLAKWDKVMIQREV